MATKILTLEANEADVLEHRVARFQEAVSSNHGVVLAVAWKGPTGSSLRHAAVVYYVLPFAFETKARPEKGNWAEIERSLVPALAPSPITERN